MPTFGSRSKKVLATVHPRLAAVLDAVIVDVDFTVLTGRRGRADQLDAKATGRSQVGWPDSRHNCPIPVPGVDREEWREDPEGLSCAVDVAPWPIDWSDTRQFCYLAGRIIQEGKRQGVRIKWGGDWNENGQGNWRDPNNSFDDLPHFEMAD